MSDVALQACVWISGEQKSEDSLSIRFTFNAFVFSLHPS
jgi:hypothetical protein